MSSSPEYVADQRWPLSAVTVSQMRDSVRAVVPEFAAAVTAAVMQTLPETVLDQVTTKITAALQNKLVNKTFTAPVSMLPKEAQAGHAPAGAGAGAGAGASGALGEPPAVNEPIIKLWPAEVAAYMGKDSRMSRDEALAAVWRRTHETSMLKVHKEWVARGKTARRITSAEVEARVFTGGPAVATAGPNNFRFTHIQTREDLQAFCGNAATSKASIQSLYLEKGRTGEDETAALLARLVDQDLALRNSASYWRPGVGAVAMDRAHVVRLPGPITDPGPYAFMGEVDGWLTEEPFKDVIVEMKTRMNGIPETIPIKDILQLQTYMMMHDKERSLHVQRAFATSIVVVNEIKRNKELWASTIEPALVQFVCDIRKLLRGSVEDELIRHRVLSAVERSSPPLMVPLPPVAAPKTPEPEPLHISTLKRKKAAAVAALAALPPLLQELPSLDGSGSGSGDSSSGDSEDDDNDDNSESGNGSGSTESDNKRSTPPKKRMARRYVTKTKLGVKKPKSESESESGSEDTSDSESESGSEDTSDSDNGGKASRTGTTTTATTRTTRSSRSSARTPPARPPVSTVLIGQRPATRLTEAGMKIRTRQCTPSATTTGGRKRQSQANAHVKPQAQPRRRTQSSSHR